MSDENVSKIIITGDATGFDATTKQVKASAEGMAVAVKKSGKDAADGVASIGNGADASAKKIDQATKGIIGSIQRTTAIMEAGEKGSAKYYEALAAQRGVSSDALKPYLLQLDAAVAKQSQATGSLNSMGMSAKQLNASLRGVPAQFTDIITSLQGGQAPMTVFMQQGGQLKDMFGGAGNAAKALGGYILGLVNPYTVAAAAVGGIAYAYHQGAGEAHAFAQSLIVTGNAVGATTGQLMDLARSISNGTGATQGAVAETLNEIAASGKVSASVLEQVSNAAINLERAGGQAAAATVKEFVALGDSPVAAILKLNEKYHFLTAAVYEQIKALQDQGRETDAARLAQSAYADTLDSRIPLIGSNLGTLEKAWRSVKDGAKSAWDAMLNVGRDDGLETQLAKAKRYAENLARSGDSNTPEGKASNAQAQQAIAAIEAQIKKQSGLTAAEVATNREREAGLKWSTESLKYLDKEAQKKAEILRVTTMMTEAGKNQAEIAKVIAQVNEKYADKKASSAKAPKEDYSELFLAQEQAAINAKALAAEWTSVEKAHEDYAKSVASMLDPMEKEAYSLERQLETYGLTRSEIEATTIARLEEAKAIAAANGAGADSIAFYEREIEARKRIASASASIDAKKATEDSAKKAASEWQKTSDKIGDSITDALMRGFESGKGFAETLRDTVVNMFKSMVLKPIIQATVISGMSALGMGSATAADSSSLGGLSNYASMGNTAYNYATGNTGSLFEKGLSLFSSGASTGATGISVGAEIGAGIGAGLSFAGAGISAAVGTGVAAGMGTALGAGITGGSIAAGGAAAGGMAAIGATGAGATVAAGGGVAAAGASSVLAAVPVAGWVALAAIAAYSIFSSPAGGPKNKIQGWGSMGADGSVLLGDKSSSLADTGGKTARKYDFSLISDVYTSAVVSAVMKYGNNYASSAKLSTTMDPEGTAKNKNVSQVARANGSLVYDGGEKTGRGSSDWAKWAAAETPKMQLALVADAMRTANDDYKSIAENFVGTSTNMTAAIKNLDSAAVSTMMATITSMATAFDSIAAHLNDSVTGQAVVNMSRFSGTIDALTANISSYYSAFFSEAEQVANTKASLTKSFADMGMALPDSKAAFRSIAEGLDLATVSGQAVFATMMSMSTAFAQVADAATASAKAASDAADALKAKFLSMYETLTNALGSMTTSTGPTISSRAYAQGSLDYVAASVKSGQSLLGFSDLITTAIDELSKSSDQLYATFEEYAISQAKSAASITYLQGNAYANSHADGLESVPYDGYRATLHAGETVVDAQSSSAIKRYFGGNSDNSAALIDELQALREEVVNLRAETRAIASHTNKSAKLLERAMPDGDALSTRVAA